MLKPRNLTRIRQVATVFIRNGFEDVLQSFDLLSWMGFRRRRVKPPEERLQSRAEKFRLTLEELGTTYIKLGQLLSTRPDLLPPIFIEELVRLQDRVEPVPFDGVRAVLEKELGCPIDEVFEITGYSYLEKKDGSLNAFTLDKLKASFGWDGRDPLWLQDADLSETVVQITLGYEQYNGRDRIKVQFIDPEDATGGAVPHADDSIRKAIKTRLGAKLRALAGSSPRSTTKPSGRPKPPKAPPKSTGTAPAKAPESTLEEAWAAFVPACQEVNITEQQGMEGLWFRILSELFPDKQPEDFTAADRGVVLVEAPKQTVPY